LWRAFAETGIGVFSKSLLIVLELTLGIALSLSTKTKVRSWMSRRGRRLMPLLASIVDAIGSACFSSAEAKISWRRSVAWRKTTLLPPEAQWHWRHLMLHWHRLGLHAIAWRRMHAISRRWCLLLLLLLLLIAYYTFKHLLLLVVSSLPSLLLLNSLLKFCQFVVNRIEGPDHRQDYPAKDSITANNNNEANGM